MKLTSSKTHKPATRFDKLFTLFLVFIAIVFFSSLGGGFLNAVSTTFLISSLFGMVVALFKRHTAADLRIGTAVISFVLFTSSFFLRQVPTAEQFTNLFGSSLLICLILLVISLVRPQVFGRFSTKPHPTRRKLFFTFSALTFVSLLGFGINAPASLASINLQDTQDVQTETYTVEGSYTGSPTAILVNGMSVKGENSTFSKEVTLKEGNNEIKVVLKEDDTVIHSGSYNVYYDYEGRLYADIMRQEERAAAELEKKLAQIPEHEVVRKEKMPDGFSAIVYVDNTPEDYLISNLIGHIRNENEDEKNMSLLVFQKADKVEVEKVLESTDVAGLSDKIRANYEKRADKEDLFFFPTGINGTKLALEI